MKTLILLVGFMFILCGVAYADMLPDMVPTTYTVTGEAWFNLTSAAPLDYTCTSGPATDGGTLLMSGYSNRTDWAMPAHYFEANVIEEDDELIELEPNFFITNEGQPYFPVGPPIITLHIASQVIYQSAQIDYLPVESFDDVPTNLTASIGDLPIGLYDDTVVVTWITN